MDPINRRFRHKCSSSSGCDREVGKVVMSEPFVPKQQPQQHPSTNLSRTRSQRDIQFPKVDPQTKGISSSSFSSSLKERPSIIRQEQLGGTRSLTHSLHFLKTCGVCGRSLGTGYDIYIYRGEVAFCSNECRELHMKHEINDGAYHLHH